jgi:hypothetical protein
LLALALASFRIDAVAGYGTGARLEFLMIPLSFGFGAPASGSACLRIVGPAYGFFGVGQSLCFASQGAGRLFGPLVCGLVPHVAPVADGSSYGFPDR